MKRTWIRFLAFILLISIMVTNTGCGSLIIQKGETVNADLMEYTESDKSFENQIYESAWGETYNADDGINDGMDFEGDITELMNSKEMQDKRKSNEELLDEVGGVNAFYIPDYHSNLAEDLISFQILDLIDEKTVVYAYETIYYGPSQSDPMNGQPKSGTVSVTPAPVHKNVDNIGSYLDKKMMVAVIMSYNTETGDYKVFDAFIGLAPAIIEKKIGSDENKKPNDAKLASNKVGRFASKYLFAHRYRGRGTGATLDGYFVFYRTGAYLYDKQGNKLMDVQLSGYITENVYNLLNAKSGWNINITNALMDGNNMVHMTVIAERQGTQINENTDINQDTNDRVQILLSFFVMNIGKGSGAEFKSKNLNYGNQVDAWQGSHMSLNTVLSVYPDKFEGYKLDIERGNPLYLGTMDGDTDLRGFTDADQAKLRSQIWKFLNDVYSGKVTEAAKETWWYHNNPGFTHMPFDVTPANIHLCYGTDNKRIFYIHDRPGEYSSTPKYTTLLSFDKNKYPVLSSSSHTMHTQTKTRTVESGEGDEDGDGDEDSTETEATFNEYSTLTLENNINIHSIYAQRFQMNIGHSMYGGYTKYSGNGSKESPNTTAFFYVDGSYKTSNVVLGEPFGATIIDDYSDEKKNFITGIIITSKGVSISKNLSSGNVTESIPYSAISVEEHNPDKITVKVNGGGTKQVDAVDGAGLYTGDSVAAEGNGLYRFTSLQSGILLYSQKYKLTYVVDSYQYYSSWKNQDGTYTAIGYQTDSASATDQNYMKAKIYRVNYPKDQVDLDTMKYLLKIHPEERAVFVDTPEVLYKKYGLNAGEKMNEFHQLAFETQLNFLITLSDFWELIGVSPTEEQEKQVREKMLLCNNQKALEELIIDTKMTGTDGKVAESYLNETEPAVEMEFDGDPDSDASRSLEDQVATEDETTEAGDEDSDAASTSRWDKEKWMKELKDAQELENRRQKVLEDILEQHDLDKFTWPRRAKELTGSVKKYRNMWNNVGPQV